MKHKLYYQDPYMKSFSTQLMRQDIDEKGNRYVVLSETAFYPTGGGQPYDTGLLNGVVVNDVEEIDGEIRHYVEQEVLLEDGVVNGVIDWDRRFDYMQQHAGQHIVSAVFEQLYDLDTLSIHIGEETTTVDLDIAELTDEMMEKAEKKANEVILENRPIEAKWVTAEELPHYPLRKQPTVKENIRLIIIQDFDYNGCGGVHPQSTGEVSAIKFLRWERQRKHVRLELVCGGRVLKQFSQKLTVHKELARLLKCPQEQMGHVVERLFEDKKTLEQELQEATDQLLQVEAKQLAAKATIIQGRKVVQSVFYNRSIQTLQKLARFVIADVNDAIVLFVTESGERLQMVAARHPEMSGNLKQAAQKTFPLIEGKGGGKEDFIQGGGMKTMPASELMTLFLENISS